MQSLSGVWDFGFFWNTFGYILKLIAPFIMIIVAVIAVGYLIAMVVDAIRNRR